MFDQIAQNTAVLEFGWSVWRLIAVSPKLKITIGNLGYISCQLDENIQARAVLLPEIVA